jgi:mitotic spindle assembly checkpoint protein MAD2B
MSARGPLVIADANSELHPVVDAFTKFLTVATHQILHAHNIYPARTFIRAKDYGLEIYQSRHPDVCKFVNNEIADIRRTILSGTVKRIFVAIFVQGLPREHFVFDITRMSKLKPGTIGEEAAFETPLPLVDAEEQMRAVLSKLEVHCTSLKPLNDPGTFRMIMEVDDGSRFSPDNEEEPNTHPGDDPCTEEHAVDMVKIRSVEAGRFVFDLWYEPARTLPRPSTDTPHHPLASDGSASSSSSDPYIPFPSTRVELKDK